MSIRKFKCGINLGTGRCRRDEKLKEHSCNCYLGTRNYCKKKNKTMKNEKMKNKKLKSKVSKVKDTKTKSKTMSAENNKSQNNCIALHEYLEKLVEPSSFKKTFKKYLTKKSKDESVQKHDYVHYGDKVKKIKNKNKYQVYLSMFVKEKDFDNIEYKAWLTDVVSEQIELDNESNCPTTITMDQLVDLMVDLGLKNTNHYISKPK